MVDGCPPKDEIVTFGIPLRGIKCLTPTLKNIFNKFSVRYYLKVVIHEQDEENNEKRVEVQSSLYEVILYK